MNTLAVILLFVLFSICIPLRISLGVFLDVEFPSQTLCGRTVSQMEDQIVPIWPNSTPSRV